MLLREDLKIRRELIDNDKCWRPRAPGIKRENTRSIVELGGEHEENARARSQYANDEIDKKSTERERWLIGAKVGLRPARAERSRHHLDRTSSQKGDSMGK